LRWLQTVALPDVEVKAVTHQQLLRSMDALMDNQRCSRWRDRLACCARWSISDLSVAFYDMTTIRAEGTRHGEPAMCASSAWPRRA
jgi:hypothetical protein